MPVDLNHDWFPRVTDFQVQQARKAVALVAREGKEALQSVWMKKGVTFLTANEVDFLHTYMINYEKYKEWSTSQVGDGNNSTSNWDWNLQLYPHIDKPKADCWYAIFHFAEHTCKPMLRPLQGYIESADDFKRMYEMWMIEQKEYAKSIRETGLKDGIPVSRDDSRWQEENLRLDRHELKCQIVRALHHMDGALLRPIIDAYMHKKSTRKKVLEKSIQDHVKKTSGVNVRDKVYLNLVLQYESVLEALHQGLAHMQQNVWAIEWCADWAPQILFWLYPRGPGYQMIQRAVHQKTIKEVLKEGLYPSLLKLRLDSKARGWQHMIRNAWTLNPLPPVQNTMDDETQRQLDDAILRIAAEYFLRERPWQIPKPLEKQLDSVEL